MAFQKGIEYVKEQAARKGNMKWTPNIFWAKQGDSKIIMWLDDGEEIIKALIHEFVRVDDDSRKEGFRYDNFLCRKDPSMVESSGGYCPLCDDLNHTPNVRFTARAVELEPVLDGKRIVGLNVAMNKFKNKDGEDKEAPRWGMVKQGAKNFFSYFASVKERRGTIKGVAWEIVREGEGTDTKYPALKVDDVDVPDLTPFLEDIPSLESLLEQMGSDEKYAELEGAEPGSQDNNTSSNEVTVSDADRSEFERIKAELERQQAEPVAA